MLQLDQSGGKLSLVAAAAESFPQQSPAEAADGRCRRRLAVEAVRDVLRSNHFRGRDVVTCLRTGDLAIKNIRLPQMPERELASAVVWEAQERFGFDVAPDRLHYIRAGEVRQATEVREEVILLAATEESVAEHLEMLAQMRLNPVHIDAEPAALFRAYRRFLRRAADESAVSVLVDIGLSATKVIVARGKSILLVKLIDLAGAKFNEGVGRGLGLAWTEAAQLRKRASAGSAAGQRSAGEHVQRSVLDAIRGPVEALAREISLCLRYCSVTFRGLRPAEVTLTGGEAYDPAVVKLLGECLDCTVWSAHRYEAWRSARLTWALTAEAS